MTREIWRFVNVALDAYALVNVLIVAFAILLNRMRAEKLNRTFVALCMVVTLMLVSDIGTWVFVGLKRPWYPFAARMSNFLQYLSDFGCMYAFTTYVSMRVEHAGRPAKGLMYAAWAVTLVSVLLLTVSQFTGWYYYFDAENIYHRGPLFLVSQASLMVVILLNSVTILSSRSVLPKSETVVLLIYGLLPLVCAVIQTLCYGLSITYLACAVSLLLAYIGIQSRVMGEMRLISEHDSLTDLFNRAALDSLRLGDYRKLTTCGIIWFDINDLKLINDRYGHDAGDKVIRLAADSIRSITNRRTHGYRMGGDEFMVVACDLPEREVEELIRLWQSRLDFLNQRSEYPCTIAVGWAWSPAPVPLDDLIRRADAAMYQAKQNQKAGK